MKNKLLGRIKGLVVFCLAFIALFSAMYLVPPEPAMAEVSNYRNITVWFDDLSSNSKVPPQNTNYNTNYTGNWKILLRLVAEKDSVYTTLRNSKNPWGEEYIFCGWTKNPVAPIDANRSIAYDGIVLYPYDLGTPYTDFTYTGTTKGFGTSSENYEATLYACWALDKNKNGIPDYIDKEFYHIVSVETGEKCVLLGYSMSADSSIILYKGEYEKIPYDMTPWPNWAYDWDGGYTIYGYDLNANNTADILEKNTEKDTKVGIKQYRLGYYDIWRNSSGAWLDGEKPNSKIYNFQTSISKPQVFWEHPELYANISCTVDYGQLLKTEFYDPKNENYNRDFEIYKDIKEDYSVRYTDTFSLDTNLTHIYMPSFQLLPEDKGQVITKDWQSQQVKGLRYNVPFTLAWQADKVDNPILDIKLNSITPNIAEAGQPVCAKVVVENASDSVVNVPVDFYIPNVISEQQFAYIAPNSKKEVLFWFAAPDKACNLTMTAKANPAKTISETNYTNNNKTANLKVNKTEFVETLNCSRVINWTEITNHTKVVSDGKNGTKTIPYTRTYYYEAALTPAVKASPTTLKSGYGFNVMANCKVRVKLLQAIGYGADASRQPSQKVLAPDKAVVSLPWSVTDARYTQPQKIQLGRVSYSNLTSKFSCSPNPISEIEAKQLYTPVDLSGTGEQPQRHNFSVSLSGGGVNGTSFCCAKDLSIIINGNMYEDDFTGAN